MTCSFQPNRPHWVITWCRLAEGIWHIAGSMEKSSLAFGEGWRSLGLTRRSAGSYSWGEITSWSCAGWGWAAGEELWEGRGGSGWPTIDQQLPNGWWPAVNVGLWLALGQQCVLGWTEHGQQGEKDAPPALLRPDETTPEALGAPHRRAWLSPAAIPTACRPTVPSPGSVCAARPRPAAAPQPPFCAAPSLHNFRGRWACAQTLRPVTARR